MAHEPTEQELGFVRARRIGRLATANASGRPAVVPFCFALIEAGGKPIIVTALDEKPKSVPLDQLQRVRNIRENPQVSIVVDDYNENWNHLQFVQLAGQARMKVAGEPDFDRGILALRSKYPQYQSMRIEAAPLIWIEELEAVSWSGSGENDGEQRPTDMTALLQGRRSVRALRPEPVPRSLVEQAIAAAAWAPSPHGRQPWRFAVVESEPRRRMLADEMSASWQAQLRFDGQDESIVQIRLQKSRHRLLEAPLIVVPCLYLDDLDVYPDPARQAAEHTMAIQSLGAALQNFLLSVYSTGLDTGWMCAPLFCPEVVRDALGLSHSLIPQALLPVGYAAKEPVRRPRLPFNDLIADWS